MDQDATLCEGRTRPRPHCVRLSPSSPTERGTAALPISRHMSTLLRPNGRPSEQLLSSRKYGRPQSLERLKLAIKFCAQVGYVMYDKTHWNFPGCRTCSVGFPREWECIIPSQGNGNGNYLSEIKRNGICYCLRPRRLFFAIFRLF